MPMGKANAACAGLDPGSDAFGRRWGDRRAGRPCACRRVALATRSRRCGQRIYKPGSVLAETSDDHSSRTAVAGSLKQPTRATGPVPALQRKLRVAPIRSCSRWGLPCRFGCPSRGALLPHRFTHACRPLPDPSAVCFLWHCPWGHPRRVLPGTAFRGARTFLPRPKSLLARRRPPDPLTALPG